MTVKGCILAIVVMVLQELTAVLRTKIWLRRFIVTADSFTGSTIPMYGSGYHKIDQQVLGTVITVILFGI